MIFVAGTMTLDPGVITDFGHEVAAMLARVRSERGCHHYSLLVEDAARGVVNVVERWEDEAAFNLHLTQPWITAFFSRFGPSMRSHTLMVYDISGSRPLPGL
jgi:quinol monooxygenase YgiN